MIVRRGDAIVVEEWDLGARIYRQTAYNEPIIERPFTEAEMAWADGMLAEETLRVNRSELLHRARQAYAANRAYLQLVSDGSAQQTDHIAQVVKLTRQMQALLPLVVEEMLSDIDPPPAAPAAAPE